MKKHHHAKLLQKNKNGLKKMKFSENILIFRFRKFLVCFFSILIFVFFCLAQPFKYFDFGIFSSRNRSNILIFSFVQPLKYFYFGFFFCLAQPLIYFDFRFLDRYSTRLNSSYTSIPYAGFFLK